jgi:hypothetical protein
MKLVSLTLISGLALGFEFIAAMPEDDVENSLVLDLLVLRFIFTLR